MPGRITARGARAQKAHIASDESTLDTPATTLRTQVCAIFAEVQRAVSGQRKLVVRLRKVQEACCYESVDSSARLDAEEFDENEFNAEMVRCTIRILPVKKSELAGDRLVRFLGMFLKHSTDAGV